MENKENAAKTIAHAKAITYRTKIYKEAARNTSGFHVHANDNYIGFYPHTTWDLDSLVNHFNIVESLRLIGITGNVLIFAK